MKELSIFVDESGDFGEYAEHSSYYIISLVFHNQDIDINEDIKKLEQRLIELGYNENHCIHSGPIVRNEEEYRKDSPDNRRKLFKTITAFFRTIDVSCKTISIEKKHIADNIEATGKLSRLLSRFIQSNYQFFLSFDIIKIYYDNGQTEVTKILSSVFNALLENIEFRKVYPSDYKLFQVADLVCTLRLLEIKNEKKELSKAEKAFFQDERTLCKNYLKVLNNKLIM